MNLLEQIKENAKKYNKRIVLPEGTEERTLKAADILIGEGIAQIILIGNPAEIKALAEKFDLKNIGKATIIDPANHEKKEAYADLLVELRKSKGMTKEQAMKLVLDPLYLATLMIKSGDADGEVAGAKNATGDVLRPALQIVKTLPGMSVVSGAFLLLTNKPEYGENGLIVCADCAVLPNPTAEELAQIAVATAGTARAIAKIEPRVAMLSFSTKGSAKNELVDKVVKATELAKQMAPDVMIDGEMQADAALVASVGASKAPGSPVAGKANVLIFPSLEVGNISYKLVQRIAGIEAVGPVLQGMAAPINDLSRGCSVSDIVNLVAITVNQAAAKAETELKRALGQTQNELKVRLFDEVKELLSDFTKTDEYLDYLCSKIREAARFADGEEMTIYISPSDKEKQTELEKRTGMTITISEYDFMGGMRAVIRGRNILIDHSFQAAVDYEYHQFSFVAGGAGIE